MCFTSPEDIKSIGKHLDLSGDEQKDFTDFFRCVNLCHDCIALHDDEQG